MFNDKIKIKTQIEFNQNKKKKKGRWSFKINELSGHCY
jgi:hypothetical protein